MGYTTDFMGQFDLDKPLKPEHFAFLKRFAETRRMKRNAEIAETLDDPIRKAAGLPIGTEGCLYVGATDDFGQMNDASVEDHNRPPKGQPGLWCQWTPNAEGTAIEWDYGEKFYYYTEWLEYLIYHFIEPWGYKLNGEVTWEGEDREDLGKIIVTDNKIELKHGRVDYF